MTEMVCPVSKTTPGIFLLNCMSREAKNANLLEHFKIKTADGENTFVEVKMTINGVEVDFSKSITEMWERLQFQYDEDLISKAKELIIGDRFYRFNESIYELECNFKEEVDKLFETSL